MGGGVILYVSDSIDAVQLDKFDAAGFFTRCVLYANLLSLPGSKLVTGGCVLQKSSQY